MITAPGLYPDLSETYHSGQHTPTRALSASGIKVLLNETPLDFISPRERKSDVMDFGTIVHKLALGKGAEFVVSPFDEYRTKEAKAWRDETIADGCIPIKADRYADAVAMADIIKGKIHMALNGEPYVTEVPFYWQEGDTWCAGMLDVWCPSLFVGLDPKVTAWLAPRSAAGHMVRMGHDIQAAWYLRGLGKIYPQQAGRIQFANILIKPDAPFTSRLVAMNEGWRHTAENECLRALRIYDRCMAAGEWPGYPDEIEVLDAPAWTLKERIEAEMAEEADDDTEG